MSQRLLCPQTELAERLMRHARSAFPKECAGIVVRTNVGVLNAIPCPDTHTTNDHFELPASLFWSTYKNHQRLVAFYHSHPNGSGMLSPQDQRAMLVGHEPAWPDVDWYVIPIDRQQVELPVRYTWSKEHHEFRRIGTDLCI